MKVYFLRFRLTLSLVHTLSLTRAHRLFTLSVRPLEVSQFPHVLPNAFNSAIVAQPKKI